MIARSTGAKRIRCGAATSARMVGIYCPAAGRLYKEARKCTIGTLVLHSLGPTRPGSAAFPFLSCRARSTRRQRAFNVTSNRPEPPSSRPGDSINHPPRARQRRSLQEASAILQQTFSPAIEIFACFARHAEEYRFGRFRRFSPPSPRLSTQRVCWTFLQEGPRHALDPSLRVLPFFSVPSVVSPSIHAEIPCTRCVDILYESPRPAPLFTSSTRPERRWRVRGQ